MKNLSRWVEIALSVLAAFVVASVLLTSCSAGPAWPDPCPTGTKFGLRECAERMAKEVCGWKPEHHAEHTRLFAAPDVDVVETHRCGCIFGIYNRCYVTTQYDRRYYVIATGAPGCESDHAFHDTGVDPARCGSIGTVGGGK